MAASDKFCCVPKCGKTRTDDTILHLFPNPETDANRFQAWVHALGDNLATLDDQYIYKNRRICHDHFETKYQTWTKRLSANAIPTLLMPGPSLGSVSVMEFAPSTSTGSSRERVSLMDITNKLENSSRNLQLGPTVSTGSELKHPANPDVVLMDVPKAYEEQVHKGESPASKKRLIKHNQLLQKTVSKLVKKNDSYATRLKKALKLSENKTFQSLLNKFSTIAAMFTVMQFREVKKPKMGRRFTDSEKLMALSLYKRSPRTYKGLQKIFVLPSAATLSRVLSKANLKPGINANLFQQLKKRVKKMKDYERVCILLFDEMSIAPHFDYSIKRDSITGFVNNGKNTEKNIADHVLVFMIRGILKNYKQPISYTFCSGSTKKIELAHLINEIINNLQNVGLHVVATVCDQGSSNRSAINHLIEQTRAKYLRENKELRRDIFEINGKEIIPLFDVPHLIKCVRNNLMEKDLKCTIDGEVKIAKWAHIMKLYENDPSYRGLRLSKKLTEHHINPDHFQKMKVKYATQTLSQTVAVALGYLAENKILPEECQETADVILFFDELFDSLNGSSENSQKRSGKDLLKAVTPKSRHHSVWARAKVVLKSMKFVEKDSTEGTVPALKNWLHNIYNVEQLIKNLNEKYEIRSVYMRHLNQDPLENFFGQIRSHRCRNVNPTPAGFESSFASLLISNITGQHSPGSNCEEDDGKHMFKSLKKLVTNKMSPLLSSTSYEIDVTLDDVFVPLEQKAQNARILAQIQYVSGYVLKKSKENIFKSCAHCKENLTDNLNTSRFLQMREYNKRRQCLSYPSNNLMDLFSKSQDIITYILKKHSDVNNIKTFMKTILYMELDFSFLQCVTHKTQLIEYILNLGCILFLCNWCKDINKILCGSRSDIDNEDIVQIKALQHYVKKKNYKKNKRK